MKSQNRIQQKILPSFCEASYLEWADADLNPSGRLIWDNNLPL